MLILKQLFKYYLYMIFIFLIGRVALLIIYFERYSNMDVNYWMSFVYGLKMDTMLSCYFLIIPAILLTFTPKFLSSFVNIFLKYYFFFVISFLLYIEVATFPFIEFYDSRPNYLFVEYLEYPKEVFGMIIADYKMALFASFMLIMTFAYIYFKNFKNEFIQAIIETGYLKRLFLFIPISLLIFIGIRSSFGHRPANISDAMYSSSRILNEITKNSLYSIVYAIYSTKKHSSKDIASRYGDMKIKEAISRVPKD